MDVESISHRKSRAPWQNTGNNNKISNPYANANTSIKAEEEDRNINPYANELRGRGKQTRRESIHAAAAGHGRNAAGIPTFNAANLPPVPQIPDIYAGGNRSAERLAEPAGNDFANLPNKIVNDLKNSSASEIDDYYKSLVKRKAAITKEIKGKINQNQQNILELTNDLRETQEELLQLRGATKQLYGVLNEFKEGAQRRLELEQNKQGQEQAYRQLDSRKQTGHKDRASVMVLEKLWSGELQALYKHVEGALKFVQPIPGRHIVFDSAYWSEVNVGTWKPINAAHIYILNDLILVAVKKAFRGVDVRGARLRAANCFPISEVRLLEISQKNRLNKEKQSEQYSINLKISANSYIYLTERYDHYLKFLEAFNKCKSTLYSKKQVIANSRNGGALSMEPTDDRRQLHSSLRNSGTGDGQIDAYSNGRNSHSRNSGEVVLQDISARVHSRNKSQDMDIVWNEQRSQGNDKQRFFNDLKKIEDNLDEVDIEIAHCRYAESVGLVKYIENKLANIESARGFDGPVLEEVKILIDVIYLKISNRKANIQQGLCFVLYHRINQLGNQELAQVIEFFCTLGQAEKGVSVYLQAMSEHLSSIVTRLIISIQGSTKIDVVNYLSNIVIINISVIKRAVVQYKDFIVPVLKQDSSANFDSSGLVNWAIDEVSKSVSSIKKYLYETLFISTYVGPNYETKFQVKDQELFREFLDVLKPRLAELKSVGINVDYLFDSILSLE